MSFGSLEINYRIKQADREEILVALCKRQKIDTAGLDLKELATLTSGFTGADLNAVLTQARLSALEYAIANVSVSKIILLLKLTAHSIIIYFSPFQNLLFNFSWKQTESVYTALWRKERRS